MEGAGVDAAKPNLVLVANPRSRREPSSPFLRFVRDYADVLRRFTINTTRGTGETLYGTGLYERAELELKRPGAEGGIAQLAAIVARDQCAAAILFLDPSDPWSEAVENRACKRACIQKKISLVTTYAAAVRWANYEVKELRPGIAKEDTSKPANWRAGLKNVGKKGDFRDLQLHDRTLALISHDKKKLDMVRFVIGHVELLAGHDRILTTGTTGWLLKLLFADRSLASCKEQIGTGDLERHLNDIFEKLLEELELRAPARASFDQLLQKLKTHLGASVNDSFTEKVMPLPSGPAGGDVLIADEVLRNECHSIIFFHDPTTAHPHNDDIRLLEHASQVRGVYAECVSDPQSAERWTKGIAQELERRHALAHPAQELRREYRLDEVILVPADEADEGGDPLGRKLARACAGYLNQQLRLLTERGNALRIGVAWGWGSDCVLQELQAMDREGLLQKPSRFPASVVWSPLIGTITAEVTHQEAYMIAQRFCDLYGGSVEGFFCAGFARQGAPLPDSVRGLIVRLAEADLILTAGSPWDEQSSLYKNTGLNAACFPALDKAVGLVSGVFLDADGKELTGEYSIVGLGFEGFRAAAAKGRVVLMCGGKQRRRVLFAALEAGLASVLITTAATATWVLAERRRRRERLIDELEVQVLSPTGSEAPG